MIRHEDYASIGIPDISWTWRGFTTWIEVKYARPHIQSRGVQKITCCKLEAQGRCLYVVYEEIKGVKRTLILTPINVFNNRLSGTGPSECVFTGFSHESVVKAIGSTHYGGDNV